MTRVSLIEGLRRAQASEAPPAADSDPPTSFSLIDRVARHRGVLVLTLRGVLDDETVAELRSAFEGLLKEPARTYALDMAAVTFVDSDGFGVLIHMQKRLTEIGRQLVLVNCQESVRLALSLTRLEVLFPLFARIEDVPRPKG